MQPMPNNNGASPTKMNNVADDVNIRSNKSNNMQVQ